MNRLSDRGFAYHDRPAPATLHGFHSMTYAA